MNISSMWKQLPLCMIVIILVLPGCWGESKKGGLVVVNVLDKALYDDCHIVGSINIQLDNLEQEFHMIEKDAEVVLYCSNYQCSTSEYVAKQLREKGFQHVYVYEGGIAEWYQAGLPIEGPHAQPYLNRPSQKFATGEQSDIQVITMQELVQKMNMISQDSVAA